MMTLIVALSGGLFVLAFTPWIGYINQNKIHHTDLMAGDEGED
jgi:hypothetical protein